MKPRGPSSVFAEWMRGSSVSGQDPQHYRAPMLHCSANTSEHLCSGAGRTRTGETCAHPQSAHHQVAEPEPRAPEHSSERGHGGERAEHKGRGATQTLILQMIMINNVCQVITWC